jgi:hypothetical protein
MDELLHSEDAFQLVAFCMQVHRELGKGRDERLRQVESLNRKTDVTM